MTTTKARIEIGSTVIESERRLASCAGWMIYEDGTARDESGYAYQRLAQALSEGHTGEAALLRAIAIGEERSFAARQFTAQKETAQMTLQAAQIRLEAEKVALAATRER